MKNKLILILIPSCWFALVLMDIIGRNITNWTHIAAFGGIATTFWSLKEGNKKRAS